MKRLSRDFTVREKALLIFLSLVLLGLFYYQFVDQPVRTALNTAQSEKDSLQTELDAVNLQIARLTQMQDELSSIKGSNTVSMMASYNNSKAELALLNDALTAASKYTVTFANVTRDGDQIRRDFTLQFTAPNYETVERILSQLAVSPYRCLIGDITCTTSNANRDRDTTEVDVSATATFHETMVGGVADAGLPADTSQESTDFNYSVDSAIVGTPGADIVQSETNRK
jgi:hypothetical protein